MNKRMKYLAMALTVFLFCTAGSCTGEDESKDSKTVRRQEEQYTKGQPPPAAAWSQKRQNIIDIETAQIVTTVTTTFFFNQGIQNPIKICPSIGFPIPATDQLTNPEKVLDRREGDVVIAQQETTGVFTGDTSGTYVICVDENGKGRIVYWEGFVQAETGEATWDREQGMIIPKGESTATVSVEK